MLSSILLPGQAVVPLGVALAHIALCLYVLFRRQLDDSINRLFIAYLLLTILWNINLVIVAANVPIFQPGFNWAQFAPYGLVILGLVYWAFGRAFLQRDWSALWGWLLGAAGLALAVSLNFGYPPLPPVAFTWSGGQITPQNAAFVAGSVWWGLFMGLTGLTAQIQYWQTQSPAHKNRLQYLLISVLLLVFGYGLYFLLPAPLWTSGLIVTWLGSAVLTYIVVAEDLLDLGTAIRRTLRGLIVTIVTVAIYISGIYVVQIFLGDILASTFLSRYLDPILLVAAVTALLLTLVYTPIRRVSEQLANRLLFGQHYIYDVVIHRYSQAISHILDLDELASTALAQITGALRLTGGALLIVDSETSDHFYLRPLPAKARPNLPGQISLQKDTPAIRRLKDQAQALAQYTVDISPQFKPLPEADRQTLKSLQGEWFVPVLKKEQLLGLFVLGPKQSGRPYTARDLRLLATLADQTALALENAALFDRVQRNLAEITGMKNLMDNIFASIDNGVITTNKQNRITLMNQAAESILQTSAAACVGQPLPAALPPLGNTVLSNLMHNVLHRGERYTNYDIIVDLPDRGHINLNLHLTPLKNARERPHGVTIVMDDLTETKRLRAVQDMFRRYVSPAVVDRLPADPSDLKLGGHRQQVTILFADIRGFTAFSEKLDPEILVDTLNQYLSIAASSILMFEGTLDKFMGDAVMGIFNAPLRQDDHVVRAVRAAMTMQRALNDLHHSRDHAGKLCFGVGLHTGEVVVGNVGMTDRMDYTAIGDAVNLAKRIQENASGGQILISRDVYTQVKSQIKAAFYQELKVKGREQPVEVYEVQAM